MTEQPRPAPGAEPEPEGDCASVPADDRIIGQAVRWSLLVVVLVMVLAGIGWLFWPGDPPVVPVEDAESVPARELAPAADQAPPEARFTDATRSAGLDFVHVNGALGERLLPETMGGGVAFLDFDADGFQDLLFVNSTAWPWQADRRPAAPGLYRNRGDGGFENVTAETGLDRLDIYGMGVAVADLDGDGYTDVFLTAVGPNRLLMNRAGLGFEDVTESAGVAGADDAWSTSAAFLDYDRDGDLDLFVCNYVEWSRQIDLSVDYRLTGIGRAYGPPTNYAGTHSWLYRNDGGGRFTEVGAEAGIQVGNPATGLPAGKALAVLPADLDGDGWTDIVVANDTVQNFVFHNRGDGTFREIGLDSGVAFDNAGAATGAMGIDAARYNNGDEFAIAIGNFSNEMSSFYVAHGGSTLFTDEAIVSGIGPGSREALSFGLFFFDYDLDGRLDLLQTNGHVEDEINTVQPSQHYLQATQLFWNCGPDCPRNFVQVPGAETGDLATPVVGRGATYGDYDRDGDLDVVITQVNRAPLLLRNDQALGHHWLRVEVEGSGANRDAIGASLALTAGGQTQRRWIQPSRSYLSQVELPVTFGLGDSDRVERLEVIWPDGATAVLEDIPADQVLTVEHPNSASQP